MHELTTRQEVRLMEFARQVDVAVDELRDAAATSMMHDAKSAARGLYLAAREDKVLPEGVRQELLVPLEAAWEAAVAGGQLFERTHGAITHLARANQYVCFLLAQGPRH